MTLTPILTLTLTLSLLRTYPCGAHRSAAAALLARTAHPPVLADAVAAALLAHAVLPAVLATCSARLPPPHSLQAAVPHVLADAAAAALPAIVAPPPVLANAVLMPPHSPCTGCGPATVLAALLPLPHSSCTSVGKNEGGDTTTRTVTLRLRIWEDQGFWLWPLGAGLSTI